MNIVELRSRLYVASQVARSNGSSTADLARLRAAKYAPVVVVPTEGLCLPRHADRPRWRRADGGPWVCGDCHPPALRAALVEWSAAPVDGWTFELAQDLAEPVVAEPVVYVTFDAAVTYHRATPDGRAACGAEGRYKGPHVVRDRTFERDVAVPCRRCYPESPD